VVVAKPTMPPGSAHLVRRLLDEHRGDGPPVGVAANPEFLREGSAVADFLGPHRIVIGSDEPGVAQKVSALYKGIQAPLLVTDCGTAELIKYASNAFLATKISFANAVANLCEALDTDVRAVMLGMGYDPRIGFEFLRPGPGYGGSCLPKDVSALIRAARDAGYDFSLLQGVHDVNRAQPGRIVAMVRNLAPGGELAGARVAVWGTAFKAGTDDLRNSPAVAVIERLLAAGAEVRAYDPVAPGPVLGSDRFALSADAYDACRDAHVVVVLTEWDEFCGLDYDKVHDLMRSAAIVDARNLLDPAPLRRRGFRYTGVGR
jgi:UDPglucose 6-dehydrogenase